MKFEPRVKLIDVNVRSDGNRLEMDVIFEILAINMIDEITITVGQSR